MAYNAGKNTSVRTVPLFAVALKASAVRDFAPRRAIDRQRRPVAGLARRALLMSEHEVVQLTAAQETPRRERIIIEG